MPNYKETTLAGSQYTRCRLVSFMNEEGAVPSVTFVEEDIINVGAEKIHRSSGQLSITYDETKSFPVFDSTTGTLSTTNTITHGELFNILYGLYLSLAIERDTTTV